MDKNERIDSLFVAIKEAIAGAQPSMWTALPGIVQSYNAAAGTCEVQPAIQAQVTDKNGKKTWTNLPLLVDVPVQFIGGGDFVFTMPVKKGDEGLIIFSCRCIDSWWQQGGVQKQAEMRMHDLSDGFLIAGFRSQARKLSNVNEDFPELRNLTGTLKFGMTDVGFKMVGVFELDGNFRLSGSILSPTDTVYTGDFKTAGNVIAGSGGADQIGLQSHKHPANNQPPTPGT